MINTFTHTSIDTDTALRAVGLALQNGAEAGIAISVAVVDPAMQLTAFAKARPGPRRTARRPAARRPTPPLPPVARPGGWVLSLIQRSHWPPPGG